MKKPKDEKERLVSAECVRDCEFGGEEFKEGKVYEFTGGRWGLVVYHLADCFVRRA